MAKKKVVGIIRIPCDGLATQKGGWVEMAAYLKTKHLPYVDALNLTALTGEGLPEERTKSQETAYALMAVFVTNWNWKGFDGKPYPKPAGNPEIFAEIRRQEFMWLWSKVWEAIGDTLAVPKQKGTPS